MYKITHIIYYVRSHEIEKREEEKRKYVKSLSRRRRVGSNVLIIIAGANLEVHGITIWRRTYFYF